MNSPYHGIDFQLRVLHFLHEIEVAVQSLDLTLRGLDGLLLDSIGLVPLLQPLGR